MKLIRAGDIKLNKEGSILISLMFPPLLLVFYLYKIKKNLVILFIVIFTTICMTIDLYFGVFISISYALHGVTILTLLLADVFLDEFKPNANHRKIEVFYRVLMSIIFSIGSAYFYFYTKASPPSFDNVLFFIGGGANLLCTTLVMVEGVLILKKASENIRRS